MAAKAVDCMEHTVIYADTCVSGQLAY